jgi:heme A synthase
LADTLIEGAEAAFAAALVLAALYLAVGLIRPSWAWATKRRSVVLRSLAIIVLAGVGFVGVIGYTLSLPGSPHALDSYLKDFDKQDETPAQGQ